MSLRISMTLESYDKQHVGREEDFRCALHRGLLSGLSGLMHLQLLLTQHLFAVAARFLLRCSLRRGSGHSMLPIPVDFTPSFRCILFKFTQRGQTDQKHVGHQRPVW